MMKRGVGYPARKTSLPIDSNVFGKWHIESGTGVN
jgi:hypothetical protein